MFKQCKFYILPPVEASTSSPVRVAYDVDKTFTVDIHSRDCESGFFFFFKFLAYSTLFMLSQQFVLNTTKTSETFVQTMYNMSTIIYEFAFEYVKLGFCKHFYKDENDL